MAAVCVETGSVVTSVTAARSQAAVCAALAFAMLGVIVNVLGVALLELCARRGHRRLSEVVSRGIVGVGAFLAVLASASAFVGTQPVLAIAAASLVVFVSVVGLVAVLWFE